MRFMSKKQGSRKSLLRIGKKEMSSPAYLDLKEAEENENVPKL